MRSSLLSDTDSTGYRQLRKKQEGEVLSSSGVQISTEKKELKKSAS